MLLIQEFSNEPKQQHTLVLPDGSRFTVNFEFKPQQTGWFITELTYGSFILRNLRITTNPNILHQFKNLLPFGLGCYVQDNQEAVLPEDFSSGRAKLYVLTRDEVELYEEILSGQATA